MSLIAYTHVVWDFNGTLFDDVQLGIDSVNRMLAPRGLPILPDADTYREKFGFPVDEYYRRLGFDFEREDYDTVLAPEWFANYMSGESSCPMTEGAEQTIAALRELGVIQLVLSASEKSLLDSQLTRLGVLDCFEEILGLDNIHARSKAHLASAWRAAHPHAKVLFVGDTEHDADVAAVMGADCLLYTGGHQPRAVLAARGVPLIDHISQVLDHVCRA